MRLLCQAYIRHKKCGPRALCARGPRFFMPYMLERAISLIFGLVVQTHSKKSLSPFFKDQKSTRPLSKHRTNPCSPFFQNQESLCPFSNTIKVAAPFFQTKKSMSPLQDYFKSIFQVHISLTVAKKRVSIITNFHRNSQGKPKKSV